MVEFGRTKQCWMKKGAWHLLMLIAIIKSQRLKIPLDGFEMQEGVNTRTDQSFKWWSNKRVVAHLLTYHGFPRMISAFKNFWNAGLNHSSGSTCLHVSLMIPLRKQFFIHCNQPIHTLSQALSTDASHKREYTSREYRKKRELGRMRTTAEV